MAKAAPKAPEATEVPKVIVQGDPNTGPTCLYRDGTHRIFKGLDVAMAEMDGWQDTPAKAEAESK